MHLTQHTVENAKPRAKPYEIHDKGRNHVKGLLLRIQPSGARTYYVQLGRGKREKVGSGALTLDAAREVAKDIIGKDARGHDFKAERRAKRNAKHQTLRGYLDGPFKEHAEANISSHKDVLRAIRKGFEHLLDKPMTDINDGVDMARWRRERSHVSVETQRRELTYLKALLNHAVKNGVIPGHGLTHFKVKPRLTDKQNARKVRYLTDEEEERLRQAMKDRDREIKAKRASANQWRRERGRDLLPSLTGYADHLEPLVLVALNTGLRRGDLLGLRWEDVDIPRKQVTLVIGKSSHARRKAGKPVEPVTLPLSSEATVVLKALKKQSSGEYVFTGRAGARMAEVKGSFEALVQRAGIENFRFHDLRHTFASRLVMAGVDINTVRELMTHSDIKMTLIYAHLSPDHKAAALDKAFGAT